MANQIVLDISKKLIGVTGRENGRRIAKMQILPAIKKLSLPVEIVFPDNIVLIGGSFIEGIEDALGTFYPPEIVKKQIGYKSMDLSINKEVK